jgi:hypothetical protein
MDMLENVEFQVAKLDLGLNDILAVRLAKPATSVVAAELRAQIERRLSLVGRVLVIDAGTELTVVARGGRELKAEPPADRPRGVRG